MFRGIAVFNQDVFNSGFTDSVAQVNKLIRDFLISLTRIFFLESDNEMYNLYVTFDEILVVKVGSLIFQFL